MTAGSDPRRWSGAGLALGLAGGVVTLAGSLLTGLLMFLTLPWRVGTVRVPVAVVIVVGGLAALFWYAPRATGTRWAALLPLAVWSVTVVVGLGAGDPGGALLLANDWVAVLCLFGGTVVAVVGTALALARPGPARVPPAEPPFPPREPNLPRERRTPPDRPGGGGPLR